MWWLDSPVVELRSQDQSYPSLPAGQLRPPDWGQLLSADLLHSEADQPDDGQPAGEDHQSQQDQHAAKL